MEGIVEEKKIVGEAPPQAEAGGALADDYEFGRRCYMMPEERDKEPRSWRNLSYGFDLDYSSDPCTLVKSRWGKDYDIALFGRLGVLCHNLHKGTNFKFVRWEKYNIMSTAYTNFYITLEAMDPATNSVFSFQTLFSDVGCSPGIYLIWRILVCRIKCNNPPDAYWDKTSSIDDFYLRPMPKWFSDHEFASDPKRFYELRKKKLAKKAHAWDDDDDIIRLAPVSDSGGSGEDDISPYEWRVYYDSGVCGRLGLYCYNFQKVLQWKLLYAMKWNQNL
ncbi:PREDICTED: UPF0725 protein At5g63820-like [Camelina sativa]|uniref:UPF0725 protein At5g63820-like n=1 Tax=Camelina sativa TaxID=90675 RepID=A0ABM0U4N4_CAMSA|nr:PREDICTED: UPF0725 protein At5g63820-like [Camelina sativa]